MQKPRLGDTVYAVGGPALPGGSDTATATITRVGAEVDGGGWEIDMSVSPACRPATAARGVLYPTEAQARADLPLAWSVAAYWPPPSGGTDA